jgi:hypothetical protein
MPLRIIEPMEGTPPTVEVTVKEIGQGFLVPQSVKINGNEVPVLEADILLRPRDILMVRILIEVSDLKVITLDE